MELRTSILVVGGGTGGIAAAIAATALDQEVLVVTEADWVGGQLTAQLVPADESIWVETVGGTARYRAYRQAVRHYYREHYPLTKEARAHPLLNPGNCMLNLCSYEPRVGVAVLGQMTAWAEARGQLRILRGWTPVGADADHDRTHAVRFRHRDGRELVVNAALVLDATDLGDLLALTGTEYRVGAESRAQTGEPHALLGAADPTRVQAFTWCAAVSYDRRPRADHRIAKPARYDYFRNWRYESMFAGFAGPRLSFAEPKLGGRPHQFVLLPEEFVAGQHPFALWIYRQVLAAANFPPPLAPQEITLINWPMNDYFDGSVIDVSEGERARHLAEARELTRSLVYWLQHEAPRPDGGTGYPGVCLRPDVAGTVDGLAQEPYIREGRRLEAQLMVTENHVGVAARTGFETGHARLTPEQRREVLAKKICAEQFADSVGTGFYGIDIHLRTGGAPGLSLEVFPYQIPLGALIPVRMRNLVPASKNLGVTHLTNGCYRLHPTEWNVGEAAGLLAAYCLRHGLEPAQVRETKHLTGFQSLLREQGVDLEWPEAHDTVQHPAFLESMRAAGLPVDQPRYFC